ncbi:hypothetical protein HFN45_32440 [Rhizobium leguminosarum]|nr:hypothetical protein [Rhizobium leguminosarum]
MKMLLSVSYPISDLRTFFADGFGRVGIMFDSLSPEDRNRRFLRSAGLPRQRLLGANPHAASEKYYFPLHRIARLRLPEPGEPPAEWQAQARFIRYYQLDSACGRIDLNIVARPTAGRVDIAALWGHIKKAFLDVSRQGAHVYPLDKAGKELCSLFQSRTTSEPVLRSGVTTEAVFGGAPVVFLEAKASEVGAIPNFFSKVQIQVENIRLYYGFMPTKEVAWLIIRDSAELDSFMSTRALRIYLSHSYCHQSNFRNLSRNMPLLMDRTDDEQAFFDVYTRYMIENGRYISSLRKSASEQSGINLAAIATLAEDMVRSDEIEAIMARHSEMTDRQNVINNIRQRLREDSSLNEARQTTPNTQTIIAFLGKVQNVSQTMNGGGTEQTISRAQLLDDFLDLSRVADIVVSQIPDERRSEVWTALTDIENAIGAYRNPVSLIKKKIGRVRSLTTNIARGRSKLDRMLLKFENSLVYLET